MTRRLRYGHSVKWCPGCSTWQPKEAFYRNAGKASGCQSRCKPCQRRTERCRKLRRARARWVARQNADRQTGKGIIDE